MSASSQGHPDHLSPRFNPPQSAQPYRSIFGSSSQPVENDEVAESSQEVDIYDILDEELPPVGDDSDDATYDASDEDAPAPKPHNLGAEGKPKVKSKRKGKESVKYSDTEIYRSESPPFYRPNRHHGPASTWRLWTQKERQVAESLETVRARDLSAHLFDAHALKRRARETRKRIAANGSQEEETLFVPSKLWTAWPMPPEEVPRLDEPVLNGPDDVYMIRRAPDTRPSAQLEESLITTMLKTSKERFRSREEIPKSYVWQKKETSHGHETGDTSGNEGGWKSEPEIADGIQYRPVVQADDDRSTRQLRPLTRHVLNQFDSLLMSLHHSRKASMVADESSASERQSEAGSLASRLSSPRKRRGTAALERSRSRGRKRARALSRSQSRTRAPSTTEVQEAMMSSSDSDSSTSETSQRVRRESTKTPCSLSRSRSRYGGRSARLAIRDWGDVLGIASMTGWPSHVVMHAAQRCADLFGEDMAFRTLDEGAIKRIKSKDGGYIWKYADGEEEPSAPRPKRARSRSRPTKGEASVATTVAAISKEEAEELSVVKSRKGKGKHRKQDLICPVKGCSRHNDGFSRTWNLNLHMKRVHPSYPWKSGNKSAPVTDEDGQ